MGFELAFMSRFCSGEGVELGRSGEDERGEGTCGV